MTLFIYDRSKGFTHEFHYQDAIVNGDYVYLGREGQPQKVWLTRNVDIVASEGDWIYVVVQNRSRVQARVFYGYSPGKRV